MKPQDVVVEAVYLGVAVPVILSIHAAVTAVQVVDRLKELCSWTAT